MTCQCSQNCGRPVHCQNLSLACWKRWVRAGRPPSGPPPPTKPGPPDPRANGAGIAAIPVPDAYDLEYARQRRAERSEREDERLYRAGRFAADMARTAQSGDRFGWRTLWDRMDDPWAVMTAFALCTSPDLLAAGPEDHPERLVAS